MSVSSTPRFQLSRACGTRKLEIGCDYSRRPAQTQPNRNRGGRDSRRRAPKWRRTAILPEQPPPLSAWEGHTDLAFYRPRPRPHDERRAYGPERRLSREDNSPAPRPVKRAVERQHRAAAGGTRDPITPGEGFLMMCVRDGSPAGPRRLRLHSRQPGPYGVTTA
jgi:hypothetical protein